MVLLGIVLGALCLLFLSIVIYRDIKREDRLERRIEKERRRQAEEIVDRLKTKKSTN